MKTEATPQTPTALNTSLAVSAAAYPFNLAAALLHLLGAYGRLLFSLL